MGEVAVKGLLWFLNNLLEKKLKSIDGMSFVMLVWGIRGIDLE